MFIYQFIELIIKSGELIIGITSGLGEQGQPINVQNIIVESSLIEAGVISNFRRIDTVFS